MADPLPPSEKLFTELELRKYNGEDGLKYIAFQGVVYDVSDCPRWKKDLHEDLHFPGLDLTTEIVDAPHHNEVFNRPCVKQVGKLKTPPDL